MIPLKDKKILLQVHKTQNENLNFILNEMTELESRALNNLLYDFLKGNLNLKEIKK